MLEVSNLKTYFSILRGTVYAVDGVTFHLDRGETMGLVGESGCGKTTMAFAITRLLPPNGRIVGGEIVFDGTLIGRADFPTELSEVLKEPLWLEETKDLVERKMERLVSPEEGDESSSVMESRMLLEQERACVEEVNAVLSDENLSAEEIRAELEDLVDDELNSFLAKRRRKRIEREIEEKMADIRWSKISMIFQGAMNAFNPVYKVGDQIMEALLQHEEMTKDEAKERVMDLFDLVGLERSRVTGYPHEFSGGMRQRAIIAMSLACNPQLIIADEPTTALDVIMQDRILAEIRDLQRELRIAMMIITHDISVVAEVAETIGIMYAGKLFEFGDIVSIFEQSANPYTIGLKGAFPSIKGKRKRLSSIPGSPPDLSEPPLGCRFHPRCKFAQEICRREEPSNFQVAENHWSLCHFAKEIYSGQLT
ncbi:MAG: ABC transporter ATP-binding protein [Thermoplasmata archaeon]